MVEIDIGETSADTESHRVRQRRVPVPKGSWRVKRETDDNSKEPLSVPDTKSSRPETTFTRRQRYILQFRATLGALVLSAITLAIAAFLLGLFQRGEWPTQSNAYAIEDATASEHQKQIAHLQETNSPYVIIFYSTKCMACRRMRAPYIRASAELSDFAPCFMAEVSQNVSRSLARKLNVTAVPSIFLVKGQANHLYDGSPDVAAIVRFVQNNIAEKNDHETASKVKVQPNEDTSIKS